MRGAEEVRPNDRFGSPGGGGDFVHVERRGVRREHRFRFRDLVEAGEDIPLDRRSPRTPLPRRSRPRPGPRTPSARRIRSIRRSASAASIFPLPTARERLPATAASPRAHASSDSSKTVTGIPAAAKDIAIPRPIVPKPTIPALATSAPLTPSGIRRDRAASRSARRRCSAAACRSSGVGFRPRDSATGAGELMAETE